MYLPLAENARPPKFKDCAKHPKVEENGFVLYYTDQCPYTYYWVPKVQEAAKEHGSRSKPFTSPRKRRPRMCLHRSQPTRCSEMESL